MSALWELVGKRVLVESARNKFGQEDPYFEEVPASRLNRAIGKKTQKRRKAIPPGLSDNDAKVLTQIKRRAYRLDYCLFNLCGIRFGWSSVIALIPVIGDIADALFALLVVKSCSNIDGDLPKNLHAKMISNVIIDFFIGLVPFVGDLADAVYKCNSRNAIILERHLREKGAKTLKRQSTQRKANRDMSLPEEFDKYDGGQETGTVENDPPTRPQPAKHPQRSRSRGGWFGGSKTREPDVEHGAE